MHLYFFSLNCSVKICQKCWKSALVSWNFASSENTINFARGALHELVAPSARRSCIGNRNWEFSAWRFYARRREIVEVVLVARRRHPAIDTKHFRSPVWYVCLLANLPLPRILLFLPLSSSGGCRHHKSWEGTVSQSARRIVVLYPFLLFLHFSLSLREIKNRYRSTGSMREVEAKGATDRERVSARRRRRNTKVEV